jgi:3-hydroxyisobutyrate dehydrogenase-like beta-hydroxyacid dehydrogenase
VKRIGLVGAGHLGAAIGRTLLRAGFEVAVNDMRQERVDLLVAAGAQGAPVLGEMSAAVDAVCVVVVNDEQLRDVVETITETARPETPVIVHSTVRPETVVQLAELARARGMHLVDAPITGGAEKADLGTLTIMLGGDEDVIQRCWPVFAALGKDIFHVGPSGAGAVIKVVNNLMSYGTYALALEAMSVAASFGVEEDTVTEVLCTGAADSRVLRTWGRTDRTRADPESRLGRSMDPAKDLRVAAVTAAAHGIVLPVTSTIVGCMAEKLRVRDKELASNSKPPIPRCTICNQELAKPFRSRGVHPECATIALTNNQAV